MTLATRFLQYLVVTITGLGIVYGTVLLRGGAEGQQQLQNMHAAAAFGDSIKRTIAGKREFSLVKIEEYTAANGSLLISGFVPTDDEAAFLRQIVCTRSLSFSVLWRLEVAGADYFRVITGEISEDAYFKGPNTTRSLEPSQTQLTNKAEHSER